MMTLPAYPEIRDFPERGGALVIGGTGGLGSAILQRLARSGVDMVFTYNSSAGAAEELVAELGAPGRTLQALQLDLMDEGSIRAAVEKAVALLGGLHTVIYAAGARLHLKFLSQLDPARMAFHMQSDVMGFFNIVQATLPHLRESRGAYVACCSSAMDRWAIKDALSVVPKSAVRALCRGIAHEEGRFGIRANAVGTGVIDGGITNIGLNSGDVPQNFIDGAIQMTPLRRIGKVHEIAETVAFLASERASFITGQTINVDGGWSV